MGDLNGTTAVNLRRVRARLVDGGTVGDGDVVLGHDVWVQQSGLVDWSLAMMGCSCVAVASSGQESTLEECECVAPRMCRQRFWCVAVTAVEM